MGVKATVDNVLGRGNVCYLARQTGIDRSHLNRVLRGHRDISLTKAVKVASAAGITLDVLWNYIAKARRERTKAVAA